MREDRVDADEVVQRAFDLFQHRCSIKVRLDQVVHLARCRWNIALWVDQRFEALDDLSRFEAQGRNLDNPVDVGIKTRCLDIDDDIRSIG
jgi:hypothetical protein